MISLRSKLTQHLLLFFFSNPLEERYLHELANILGVKAQNLQRKLKELIDVGLFNNNGRYYSINPDWPLYPEYRGIIRKTIGVPMLITESLAYVRYISNIDVNIGSNPFDIQQEVQVLVCGRPSERPVLRAMKRLEKELGRKITVRFRRPRWEITD